MTETDAPSLDVMLKRLHLANARRVWRDLVRRAEQEQLGYEAFLRILIQEEIAHRKGTRLRKAAAAAKFPFLKTIEEFDFTFQSTLRLAAMGSFLSPDFVTEGRSLILCGKPGRGKTHLAIAIAYRAIQNGFDASSSRPRSSSTSSPRRAAAAACAPRSTRTSTRTCSSSTRSATSPTATTPPTSCSTSSTNGTSASAR